MDDSGNIFGHGSALNAPLRAVGGILYETKLCPECRHLGDHEFLGGHFEAGTTMRHYQCPNCGTTFQEPVVSDHTAG